MRLPKDFDGVDLLYAAHSLCSSEPLNKAGLNRNGYRGAKMALLWFVGEIDKAICTRTKRFKRARKKR